MNQKKKIPAQTILENNGLTPQAVELERLRAQLKAIQNELTTKKDLEQNLAAAREQLADSERDRRSL
jgi:hypothetical protein